MACKINRKDDKMFDLQTDNTKKCRCGCSVVIYPWEKEDKKLCRWCGRMVYRDAEQQKKHNFISDMKEKLKAR